MPEHYSLTPSQVAALRALGERIVESSPEEVAVSALLLPNQARDALAALERRGLASSWVPITGRTGAHLYVLTDDGQTVYRALAQFRGSPAVGALVRIPSPSRSWFRQEAPSAYVEIAPENGEAAVR